MPVTDEQVTALRAFLAFDPIYERLTRELAASGRWPGFDEVLQLGAHDGSAADRAAQHGLIQDDPVRGGFGPGEQFLAGEAESHGPFGEIV